MPKYDTSTFTEKQAKAFETVPVSMKDAVYKNLLNAAAVSSGPKSPVSVLSTENAKSTLNRDVNKLNQISPSTAPGYVPPTTNPTEPKVLPKAYFTNQAGQEAEFTEEQLKDKNIRKMIEDQGYVQTRTEGPNYTYISDTQDESDELSKRIERIANDIDDYNIDDDPTFTPKLNVIKEKYATLKKETIKTNYQREQALKSLGARGGTTRYSGLTQLGIMGEELEQGDQRIRDVIREEAEVISAARYAHMTGKYAEFNQKMQALEKVRDTKNKEIESYNKTLSEAIKVAREANKEIEDENKQSIRDAQIASLVDQGVTKPSKLLEYLNYDENGNQVGNFTLKEVSSALGILIPKKTGTGGSTNKITFSEATSRGLPLSVVGMYEDDINRSFLSSSPPDWFIQKANSEQRQSLIPEVLNRLWSEYQAKYNSSVTDLEPEKKQSIAQDYTQRAKEYFKSTYGEDVVDDETAEILAEEVQSKVEGGLSYAKAIEDVIEEFD